MSDKPREFWIDPVGDTVDGEFDAIVCDKEPPHIAIKEPPHIAIHVIEFAAFEKLKAENERLKVELAKWKNIEQLAECTYKEIYANVYKLKPGKYAPNARDLPCCNCGDPDNAKIHDEICDILEERGFNGADVCTASVGIWAALAWYERLKAKLAEVEAEATSLKDQLAWSIKNENMYKAETHTALINLERMREQLSDCGALYEGANVMREAWRQSLELFTPNPGEELTEYGEGAKQTIEQMREQYEEAIAKADEIRQGPKK